MRSKLFTKNRCLGSSAAFACKIHVSICSTDPISIAGSLQSPSVRILYRTLAQNPCVGILYYKIHGPSARYMSPGPREDPCLRIHVSVSICASPLLYKIHISEPMSQHPYLRALRSLSHDTLQDLRLNVSGSMSPRLCLSVLIICGPYMQDPCLWSPHLRPR